jgi:hypothetical protein
MMIRTGYAMVLNRVLLLVYLLLLYSCATTDDPVFYYNEVMVRNLTKGVVGDVTIRADQSQRMFGCSNIPPLGQCSTQFPKREYLKSPIRIDWTLGNRSRQTNEFILEIPASFSPAIVLRGVLEVHPNGSINTFFEQGNPGY